MGAVKNVFLLIGLGAVFFATQGVDKKQLMKDVMFQLEKYGDSPEGMFYTAVALAVGTIICFPVTILELFIGYTFGFYKGMMIIVLGKQSGGVVAYWLGRTLMRQWVLDNVVAKFKILRALEKSFQTDGLKTALLFRSMYIPVMVKNYGCAALGCGFWQASIASMVFGPLYGLSNLYIGGTARNIMELFDGSGKGDPNVVYMTTAIGAIGVLSVGVMMKVIRKKCDELVEEQDGGKAVVAKTPPTSGKKKKVQKHD